MFAFLAVGSFSIFSKTGRFPLVFGGFLEIRIPGKNGEGNPRALLLVKVLCLVDHFFPVARWIPPLFSTFLGKGSP